VIEMNLDADKLKSMMIWNCWWQNKWSARLVWVGV